MTVLRRYHLRPLLSQGRTKCPALRSASPDEPRPVASIAKPTAHTSATATAEAVVDLKGRGFNEEVVAEANANAAATAVSGASASPDATAVATANISGMSNGGSSNGQGSNSQGTNGQGTNGQTANGGGGQNLMLQADGGSTGDASVSSDPATGSNGLW